MQVNIQSSHGIFLQESRPLPRVGLMVETSHRQNRIIGDITFLGHIWMLRVYTISR